MSEWLRRQTRNLLGFACAGSNPAVDDSNFSSSHSKNTSSASHSSFLEQNPSFFWDTKNSKQIVKSRIAQIDLVMVPCPLVTSLLKVNKWV
ncbi:hypothetical protein L6164_024134 [Bauhinia variegata]|uniref:Uncharacterized protein n=1 Tax=Bauhinia variegata TaxID=167791 RepID=A0ACB9LXF6_BAUVA|nr:hypothetical protein L6164_024134 [Bauhinia variegata]